MEWEEFEKERLRHQEELAQERAKERAARAQEKAEEQAERARENAEERAERAREREEEREERARERARDREEFEKQRAKFEEDYAMDRERFEKQRVKDEEDRARDREKFEKQRAKDEDNRARDRVAYQKDRQEARKLAARQQEEISYLMEGMASLTTWATSQVISPSSPHRMPLQDSPAMAARTASDDVAKFLCQYFNLPGTHPGFTNATAVFTQWLDSGAETMSKTGDQESEDSLRKRYFQQQLLTHIAAPHSNPKLAATPTQLASLQKLQALSYLYHSDEALDVLTQRKHIIREDTNFAAHNILSLDRFSLQLEEGRTHLKDESLRAMKVLVQVCRCVANDSLPKETPPVGSALGTLGLIASPSTSTATASPPPPALRPVSVPPSTSHPVSTSPASAPSPAPPNEPESHFKA